MDTLPQLAGDVLVVGDVMEDIIVFPEGPMVRGSDVRAKIRSHPGGSGANQATWLAAMGAPVRFLARVGIADIDAISGGLKSKNIVPLLRGDKDLPTGRLMTLVTSDGERSFFTDRGANAALSSGDVPTDLFDEIGLLHFSGYAFFEPSPRAAALGLLARAKPLNTATSIDPASIGFLSEVGTHQFLSWTSGVKMCFPNYDEAQYLSGHSAPSKQIEFLSEYYDLIVVKLGANGAIAGDKSGILARAPAPTIEVVDTTGAGDAFFAGFIAALQHGLSLQECLAKGNQAGAQAASHIGGQPESSYRLT